MVNIKGLTFTYPNGKGVKNASFEVNKGEVVGFLGPNGAGKTTTIRCILGFMKGNSGTCKIDGKECFENAEENMKDIGFIAGEIAFPENMRAKEYFEFISKIRGCDMRRCDELCKMFEVDTKQIIQKLSKGNKQKVALVSAFMHDPKVLILDEPSSGLDLLMQHKFLGLVNKAKAEGKSVLMSTHNFNEVERTCDRVVIIKDGEIRADKKLTDIKNLEKTFLEVYDV
ncbi:MAG: ATP-binding cassette domain-containing protein [Christensenellaceae bacterium]|jgi:ABC-2 type transport system ATP-binding protein|nr:ATP-binding cassette domain-containing protein [Christensenellaceae bacterium]